MPKVDDQKSIKQILDYWFGNVNASAEYFKERSDVWYKGGEEQDREIKDRFGQDLQNAILETNLHWAENSTGALALVVLLDQFSRHVFRKTVQAFAQDPLARAIAYRSVNQKFDHELSIPERLFLYHPFHHSESLEDQDFGIQLVSKMLGACQDEWEEHISESLDFFKGHREVIARFGRFPHRNVVLGRTSTSEELDFLKTAPRHGQ